MNTETGQIYTSPEAIDAARARGEPLVEIGEDQAHPFKGLNRHARRREAVLARKRMALERKRFAGAATG